MKRCATKPKILHIGCTPSTEPTPNALLMGMPQYIEKAKFRSY